MAEPKKQDLIEQYEELVKKRHALEAKKQLALTVGAVDVIPGASAARGAYQTRKALGAAGEVAGAARVGEEAAGLAAREAESAIEVARLRRQEAEGGLAVKDPYGLPELHPLTNPQGIAAIQRRELAPLVAEKELAERSLRQIEEARERYPATLKEATGMSDADIATEIAENGMNPRLMLAYDQDWITSIYTDHRAYNQGRTISYRPGSEEEALEEFRNLFRDESGSVTNNMASAEDVAQRRLQAAEARLEQAEEELGDIFLAAGGPVDQESLDTIAGYYAKQQSEQAQYESGVEALSLETMEELIARMKAELNALNTNKDLDRSDRINRQIVLQNAVDDLEADLATGGASTLDDVKESLEIGTPANLGLSTTARSRYVRDPHTGKVRYEMSNWYGSYPPVGMEEGLHRAYQKGERLLGEAKQARMTEAQRRKAYEAARAQRLAARGQRGIADMSAADLAKQYAQARAKVGAMFTPVVGAAAEWREADQELAKVNAQLKALTEGASPKDRVRLEDYLMSEGSPAPEEEELKWGEPTEEPPE